MFDFLPSKTNFGTEFKKNYQLYLCKIRKAGYIVIGLICTVPGGSRTAASVETKERSLSEEC